MTTSLPTDLYSGWLRAVDRALDAPHRMLDRFHESYSEADDMEEDDSRGRSSRRTRVVEERHENSSASSHTHA